MSLRGTNDQIEYEYRVAAETEGLFILEKYRKRGIFTYRIGRLLEDLLTLAF